MNRPQTAVKVVERYEIHEIQIPLSEIIVVPSSFNEEYCNTFFANEGARIVVRWEQIIKIQLPEGVRPSFFVRGEMLVASYKIQVIE